MEVQHHKLEVYRACVISQKQVWIRCSAFGDGRICVDTKQCPGHPRISTTNNRIFSAEALITEDRCIKLTDIASELDIFWVGSTALSMTNWVTEDFACWLPKNLTDGYKVCCMGLSLIHVMHCTKQGCSCCSELLQRVKHGFIT
jgi:hypothetical protein